MTPNNPSSRNLGIVALTTLLVSAHYGSGFVLGTAEQTYRDGAIGSLYAVAVGVGSISLVLLAQFYWQRIEPLWTILGDRYGPSVKVGIGLMSWASLIGIGAVQILAIAAIVNLVGGPPLLTMVAIAILLCGIALLPVERASWLFRSLLLVNVLVLGVMLWRLDHGQAYGIAIHDFFIALPHTSVSQSLGVAGSTILLVLIDMKSQQFVVRSQSLAVAVWGCVLSGGILIGVAFLPTAIVLAAQKTTLLPPELPGRAVIPYLLGWLGGGIEQPLGAVFVLSLALPALGLGSNVLRIQTKASLDLTQCPDTTGNQVGFTIINTLLALGIALNGGEIVSLIVCFYAAYFAAIWVPFIAYLLEVAQTFQFAIVSIRWALATGIIGALGGLSMSLFAPQLVWFNSPELTILTLGLIGSLLSLMGSEITKAFVLLFGQAQEDVEG
ncbi:MAG: hypothetical protein F6J87_02545 [Spirulina sp. SIO3F2]|nr:hypothetical protein [Spirulina sp. SIO3F2]